MSSEDTEAAKADFIDNPDFQALFQSLPEAQQKHLDPTGPIPMKMMAAKGMAPLPPKEMVIVLCGLTFYDNEKLRTAAGETLGALPDKILGAAIGALPPPAYSVIATALMAAEEREDRDSLFERIALTRDALDDALAIFAASVSAGVAEILAESQERCMRSENLVGQLRLNENLLKSSLDRLFDFLVRAGIFYEDMPEFSDAMARLSPAEVQLAVEEVELPKELNIMLAVHPEADTDGDSDQRAEKTARDLDDKQLESEETHERVPMLKLISGLKISQKIALANKGNKEARTILIRASNKLVAAATIRSPRITDGEILAAAKSKSVSDEVVKIIAGDKEMSRAYAVKRALVNNPKTPQPKALRLLSLLRASDIKDLAKSKAVPSAVSIQAKRLMLRKKR